MGVEIKCIRIYADKDCVQTKTSSEPVKPCFSRKVNTVTNTDPTPTNSVTRSMMTRTTTRTTMMMVVMMMTILKVLED